MKKLILLLSPLFFYVASVSAQDVITMTNGEDVLEKVLLIRHDSGRNEVLGSSIDDGYGAYDGPAAGIMPGMKYRELKHIYDYEDWCPDRGDKYNPTVMGLCSFLVPGVGQMISGEVGRGFAWLGGAVGCYLLTNVTTVLGVAVAFTGNGAAATLLLLSGPAAMLTVDICAIVDACRVAKVKSMYAHDLRKFNYTIDLRPSINYIALPNGIQPTAGLTLAMNF